MGNKWTCPFAFFFFFFDLLFVCFFLLLFCFFPGKKEKCKIKAKQKQKKSKSKKQQKCKWTSPFFPIFSRFLTFLCFPIYFASCFFRFWSFAFWFSMCFPFFCFFSSLKNIRTKGRGEHKPMITEQSQNLSKSEVSCLGSLQIWKPTPNLNKTQEAQCQALLALIFQAIPGSPNGANMIKNGILEWQSADLNRIFMDFWWPGESSGV